MFTERLFLQSRSSRSISPRVCDSIYGGAMTDETVEIRVNGARALFIALDADAARRHMEVLENEATLATAFTALLQLARVATRDDTIPERDQLRPLHAFIGKRLHLKLKKTVRDGLAACIPIVLKMSAGGPAAMLLAAVGALAAVAVTNTERLEPVDWEICLAVELLAETGTRSTEEEIHRFVNAAAATPNRLEQAALRLRLQELSDKKILVLRQDHYEIVK
jgi:hypothetical protein